MAKNATGNHGSQARAANRRVVGSLPAIVVTGIAACASAQAPSDEGWGSAEAYSGSRSADAYAPAAGWRSATPARPEALLDVVAARLAEVADASSRSIAISDFDGAGGTDCGFADFVGETLTTRLANSGRFQRIRERRLLAQVLKEQNLQAGSYLVNPASRKKVGRLLGADAIVAGVFADLGDAVSISARLIDVESGDVLKATQVQMARDARLNRLLCGAGVSAPVENRPPQRADGVRWQAPGRSGGSANCDAVQPWVGHVDAQAAFSSLPENTYMTLGFSYGDNIWVEIELDGRTVPLCGEKRTVQMDGRTFDVAPPTSRVRVAVEEPAAQLRLLRRCWAFNHVTGRFSRMGTGDYDTVKGGSARTAHQCSHGR